MSEIAKGEFVVTLLPLVFEGQPDGATLGRLSIEETITGEFIAGTPGGRHRYEFRHTLP